jgi:hypothetical protein
MPLNKRILKVTISLPSGDVVLDQNLAMRVSVKKMALNIQSIASVEVMNLSTSLRAKLISQFTAFHKRIVDTTPSAADNINIKIEAGYDDSSNVSSASGSNAQQTAVIFIGQVVLVDPVSSPPDIGVRITCWTRQIDKLTFTESPMPYSMTYKALCVRVSDEMGLSNPIIETSQNDQIVKNPARSIYTVSALLPYIQDLFRGHGNVAAFVDNDQLIVKDVDKIINTGAISQVSEFIGTPMWTEWGVQWVTLMDTTLKLAQAATLNSLMNPSLNGTYVITCLDYDLTTRDEAFYVKAEGQPSA